MKTQITALFFLPLPANEPSPSANLISHFSRHPSAKPLPAYALDHRLLINTTSLLPSSDVSARRYTQFLTLSQLPGRTSISTTSASEAENEDPSLVVISRTHQDELLQTVVNKMAPLWAFRTAFRVDGGLAVEIDDRDGDGDGDGDAGWRVRIGDLRVTGGQGQGRVRGVVIQIDAALEEDDDGDEEGRGERNGDGVSRASVEMAERKVKAFFEAMVRNSEFGIEGVRSVIKTNSLDAGGKEVSELNLVKAYMELLRFSRAA